jgi:hypothetical protein
MAQALTAVWGDLGCCISASCLGLGAGGLPPLPSWRGQDGPPEYFCQYESLAVDFGQVCNARADGADAVQQVQAVAADDVVVRVDLDGGEEGVDRGA